MAAAALGPCRRIADLSWPHREAVVVELEAATGERVVAKAHRRATRFEAESLAYERWVPSLGQRAPQLIAADPVAQVIIVTKLDGRPLSRPVADVDLPEVYRQAGELLARYHRADPPVRINGYADQQRQRFADWIARAGERVLDYDQIAFVERKLAVLDEAPDPFGVPCHRDWQPFNWIVDEAGVISVIDFELSQIDPWYEDLLRLWWYEWTATPQLAAPFFDGYGRRPSESETRMLLAKSALDHLIAIVWAAEHADDSVRDHAHRSLSHAMQLTRSSRARA